MESDLIYFRRRASEERTAALQVPNRNARDAHLRMAERYEELVRGIARGERRVGAAGQGDQIQELAAH
jgi:hypothetical protein